MVLPFKKSTAYVLVFSIIQACKSIHPAPPSLDLKPIPTPKQPLSTIDIPVSIDLKNYFKQAEDSVPQEFTGEEKPCEGIRYDYLFKRSPFDITGSGNSIHLGFIGKYQIHLEYCAKCAYDQCIVPRVMGSCGIGEPLRKINIGYTATFSVLPTYKIKSTTTLQTLEPVDRCNLTMFKFDITNKLIERIKSPLTELGQVVDEKIAAYDLKPKVAILWKQLSNEISLGSYGYLSLNPKTLAMSSLNMKGSKLNFSLSLAAKPVLRTESKPETALPLANMVSYIPGNGFRMYFDLFVRYDSLSRLIGAQVNGTVIKIKRKKVVLKKLDIYGIGNEKIVIKVDFGGTRKGTMYLIGTPAYQSLTNEFSIPDIAFDIKTRSLLFKMARWMFSDKITQAMRQGVRYNFTNLMEESRINLQKQLNHDFGKGIKSSGQVSELSLQEIYPAKNNVILRVLSEGELKVEMK